MLDQHRACVAAAGVTDEVEGSSALQRHTDDWLAAVLSCSCAVYHVHAVADPLDSHAPSFTECQNHLQWQRPFGVCTAGTTPGRAGTHSTLQDTAVQRGLQLSLMASSLAGSTSIVACGALSANPGAVSKGWIAAGTADCAGMPAGLCS